MAFDLARTRADTSMIDEAVKSADVNRNATALTETTIQNFQRSVGQGLGRAGELIGEGLQRRRDREDSNQALARSTQRRGLEAQNLDLDQRARAQSLLAGSSVDTVGNIMGRQAALPPSSDIAKAEFHRMYGDSVGDYDSLPLQLKQPVQDLVDESLAERVRVHGGGPDAGRTLGKYGADIGSDPSEVGPHALEAFRDKLRALPRTNKAFSEALIDGVEKTDAVRRADADKNPEIAQARREFWGDKRTLSIADALDPRWDGNTPEEFTLEGGQKGRMSLRQYAMSHDISPQAIERNAGRTQVEVPRMFIKRSGGGKETIEPSLTHEMLTTLDKSTQKLMAPMVGQSPDQAWARLASWQATDQIVQKIESGEWAAGAKSPAAKSVAKTLSAQVKKMDRDQVRGVIASRLGWIPIPDNFFAKSEDLGGESGATFSRSLRDFTRMAPELNTWLSASHDHAPSDAEATEADRALDTTFEAGLEKGTFTMGQGPFSAFKQDGMTSGEISRVLKSFVKSSENSPEYGQIRGLLTQGGMDAKEAALAARTLHPGAIETLQRVESGFVGPDGKRFDEYPKKDQSAIRVGILQDLVDPVLDARGLKKGVESRITLSKVAQQPGQFLTTQDARKVADDTVALHPELKEGNAEISIPGSKSRMLLSNGRPTSLIRPTKDGGTEVVPLVDRKESMPGVDEAFRVSKEVYSSYAPTSAQRAFQASQLLAAGVGDPVVDGFLRMPVGPTGQETSLYRWVDTQMSADGGTKDPAMAMMLGLSKHAQKEGIDLFELRDRFVAAAGRTQDPVIDSVAMFLSERTTPNKTTMKDLEAIKGSDPDLKPLGNAAYKEARSAESQPAPSDLDALRGASARAASRPSLHEQAMQDNSARSWSPSKWRPADLAQPGRVADGAMNKAGDLLRAAAIPFEAALGGPPKLGGMKAADRHEYQRDARGRQ